MLKMSLARARAAIEALPLNDVAESFWQRQRRRRWKVNPSLLSVGRSVSIDLVVATSFTAAFSKLPPQIFMSNRYQHGAILPHGMQICINNLFFPANNCPSIGPFCVTHHCCQCDSSLQRVAFPASSCPSAGNSVSLLAPLSVSFLS